MSAKELKRKIPVPDKIFTFGEYWTEQLTHSRFWKEEDVLSIGNFHFEKHITTTSRKRNDTQKNGSYDILFTTQRTTRNESILFLKDVLKIAAEKSIPLMIKIKIHPVELSFVYSYRELEEKYPHHCEVILPNQNNLYQLLSEVQFHFSVYSTTHFESVHLGTPTLVLALKGHEYVNDLIRRNYARLCKTPNDFISLFCSSINNDQVWMNWTKDTNFGKKNLFARNPAGSAVNYINGIVAEG